MKGSMDYFSSKVDTYEPMIEDFAFHIEYHGPKKAGPNDGFTCRISSSKKFLFNVNQSFLAPLYRTYLDYQALQSNDQKIINQ